MLPGTCLKIDQFCEVGGGVKGKMTEMGQCVNNHWSSVIHIWDVLYYSISVCIWILLEQKEKGEEERSLDR